MNKIWLALVASGAAVSWLAPTPAHSQTLLETFAFVILQQDVKETGDGDLQIEDGDIDQVWSVKDAANCIIRIDHFNRKTQGKGWQQFYLNNILPRYQTGQQPPSHNWLNGDWVAGDYYIRLAGEDAVRCEFNLLDSPGRTMCDNQMLLYTPSPETLDRLERALDYIYSKFCSGAKYEKPY